MEKLQPDDIFGVGSCHTLNPDPLFCIREFPKMRGTFKGIHNKGSLKGSIKGFRV